MESGTNNGGRSGMIFRGSFAMKKQTQIIFFLLLLTGLLLPSSTALSQDEPGFDDYTQFIWEIMTINALGGDSVTTLSNIQDASQDRHDDIIALKNSDRGKALAAHLEEMIKIMDARDREERDREQTPIDNLGNIIFVIHAVLADGADAVNENDPDKASPVIAKILPVLQKQTKQNAADTFYGHIASQIPDSGSAISSSSSQVYHVDAGLPNPSAPPVISEVDTPTAAPTSAPIIVPTVSSAGDSGGSDVNILKPLLFTNKGLYDATVRAFSYTPADGVTASMSRASTVVFRDSNSTAYLDLPIGTYVFCYDWDLGTDADNDGYVDYAHKNTSSVTLTAQSTDNMNSARAVTLNPGSMNNPNGKCGETAPPPPTAGNAGGLTPQELANQGTHTYRVDCPTEEMLGAEAAVTTFKFVAGGFERIEAGYDTYFFQRIDVNTYSTFETTSGITLTYIFTNEGFTAIFSGEDDSSMTCTGIRK